MPEFDNPDDIKRDIERAWAEKNEVVKAWRELDDLAAAATKSQLVTALMYLNHEITGTDRKAIYRILGREVPE